MDFKSKRIGEFGEKQMMGINLAIKGTAKKYKFITGWELEKDWNKYPSFLVINLIVDLDKVGEYYDIKMKDYWLKEWKSDNFVESHYLLSLAEDRTLDSLGEKDKLENTINQLYKLIPDNLSVFYEFDSGLMKKDYKCTIQVTQFQNKPTQNIYYSI
jgi:hypothetical protein